MDNWKRVFAIIWTGQFLSILTSSIVNFAIVLWLSLETGSAEVCYDGRFVTSICFGAFHGDLYRPVEKEAGDDYGR